MQFEFSGTNTNARALIKFKPGAFFPGVPVQPVLLRPLSIPVKLPKSNNGDIYRRVGLDSLTWTMYQNFSTLACFWFTLCQINVPFVVSLSAYFNVLAKFLFTCKYVICKAIDF